jgi:peptidoglycan/xylan/chitin deacetylase (PgdA/CDA1 family)
MITRRGFLKLAGLTISFFVFPPAYGAGPRKVPVLMYHNIAFHNDEYSIAPPFFTVQMEALYSEGYQPVFIHELTAGRSVENPIIITFDDGYTSFGDYVFPLLENYKFKATMNLIGKYINSFSRIDGNRLSWDECRYMFKTGLVEFGCHTYDLHNFSLLQRQQLSSETIAADLRHFQKRYMQELGKAAEVLAWPYGIYNSMMITEGKKAGFKYMLTSTRAPFFIDRNSLFEIPRINIVNAMSMRTFKEAIGLTSP